MEFIELKEITKEHLKDYWQIFAVDGSSEFARKVWDSQRILPFVGRDDPGTLVKVLYVQVADLKDSSVQPLLDKLSALDHMGSRRIVKEMVDG